MSVISRVARAAVAIGVVVAVPAFAQDEAALKSALEGRRVTLRIAMPGSSGGVDVPVDADRSLDLNRYRNDLRRYGTAIQAGDSAMVTLVKVKDDLIEFQLDGGGYGTAGDDTSTSVNMPDVPKSDREKTLEKAVKEEKDAARRKPLQAELNRLRQRRESENRMIGAQRARAEEMKRGRLAENRLQGGSRFNIRNRNSVPNAIRAEDVMTALVEYVDFAGAATEGVNTAGAPRLRKGMLRADVEGLFGRGSPLSERKAGDFVVVTLTFVTADQRITAEFVEDVLVRYSIASK
jgi:hypothetical protein